MPCHTTRPVTNSLQLVAVIEMRLNFFIESVRFSIDRKTQTCCFPKLKLQGAQPTRYYWAQNKLRQ